MIVRNPILTGCCPDPSVCRVGEDYYLVNSTFEFFPGVPIYHSKDLVNWEQIGHCISREEQLQFAKGRLNSTGIFAPTIRYNNGIFYMVTTNMNDQGIASGNFFMWAENPAGPWSNAIFLDLEGIDPSFYFEENRAYYTGTSEAGIYIQEVDLDKGVPVGESKVLWPGTGGAYPEGPHIYKKGDWYYLMISEGGTERCHMVTMARSNALFGTYEACPHNPLMTNRSLKLPLQAIGHADLVQDVAGNWWAICLGIRPLGYPPRHHLGRETMLVPVDWSGDWPIFGDNGAVHETFETDKIDVEQSFFTEFHPDFTKHELELPWNHLYEPKADFVKVGDGTLTLLGDTYSLAEANAVTWVGVRQKHFNCEVKVTLNFPTAQVGEEAGVTVYMNERHHYDIALYQDRQQRKLIFRRQIGRLWKIEDEVPYTGDEVTLIIRADEENYSVYYVVGKEEIFFGQGEVQYLTTEVGGHFTGNYIALYASGNGQVSQTPANFIDFHYGGQEKNI